MGTYVRAAEPMTVQWRASCQYVTKSSRYPTNQRNGKRARTVSIVKFGLNQIEAGLNVSSYKYEQ